MSIGTRANSSVLLASLLLVTFNLAGIMHALHLNYERSHHLYLNRIIPR